MSLPRVLWCCVLLLSACLTAPTLAQAQADAQEPAQLWADWNHYVLIARPELARGTAEQLIALEDQQLLRAVESGEYENWPSVMAQAQRVEGLGDVARQLEQRVQQARIGVSREPERITQDIQLLPEGGRAYQNAVGRLRAAGQFATPQLLQVLRDQGQARLHPYVMQALVEIGQPVVAPLVRALPELDAATQVQVAQVLAEVGYPLPSMAGLRQVIENQSADAGARRAAERAYEILQNRSDLPPGLSASNLFLIHGEQNYAAATRGDQLPGLDASANQGIVWEFNPRTGLIPVPVPAEVFGDVLAMKAARTALQLNPNLDSALGLYLAANLRRENRLPEGAQDPSYPADAQPAPFYAMLAGPERVESVLVRALRDTDAALILDAVDVLAKTAGTDFLIARGESRPLLRALSFPDQRVRFHAAEALANARPTSEFEGHYRVVPVLAEVIRPADAKYALVLAGNQERLNELMAAATEQGYEAFGGLSLEDTQRDVRDRPSVDLVLADLDGGRMANLLRQTRDDYKLGSVPVVALVTPDRAMSLRETLRGEGRLTISTETGDAQTLASAIEQAIGAVGGTQITGEESTRYALNALQLLREVALGQSVYQVGAAEAALIGALRDERPEIVSAAGDVLALIDSERAQRGLAEAAVGQSGELQVSLLNSLAQSGTHFGNLVGDEQLAELLTLVQGSTGETAIAAARAHGALNPPTQNAVQMIAR